jgi:hypothetical protein
MMKDWNELVLGLIRDLGCYVAWLNDFRDGSGPEERQAIIIDQAKAQAMIDTLRAHKVGEIHPDLERLMYWDPGLGRSN